jgi:hypothetical protein
MPLLPYTISLACARRRSSGSSDLSADLYPVGQFGGDPFIAGKAHVTAYADNYPMNCAQTLDTDVKPSVVRKSRKRR